MKTCYVTTTLISGDRVTIEALEADVLNTACDLRTMHGKNRVRGVEVFDCRWNLVGWCLEPAVV